jgi:Tfp pilus assembly protein PilO
MRRLPVIGVVVAVLIGAAWWMFFIGPRQSEISRLEAELASAVDREQLLRVQIRRLEEVRDREVQYVAALQTLDQLIPEEPRLDEIIEDVHRLALDSGVVLVALSPTLPAPTPGDGDLRSIVITTRVEGEFFQVLGFLFGLHDLDRLVRVDAVAISSSQDEFGFTTLAVSLQLRLFTLSDVLPELFEAVPPIDGPAEDDGGDGEAAEDPGQGEGT